MKKFLAIFIIALTCYGLTFWFGFQIGKGNGIELKGKWIEKIDTVHSFYFKPDK